MNKLLIGIAQRLVHKAIEVNTKEFNVKISLDFIGGANSIIVALFDKDFDCKIFYLYDDNPHNRSHISQFRYILRKIRKRVL